MHEGNEVTLDRDVPRPEEWERHENHYYKHRGTGKVIHEESYRARVEERKTLARYIDEVEDVTG